MPWLARESAGGLTEIVQWLLIWYSVGHYISTEPYSSGKGPSSSVVHVYSRSEVAEDLRDDGAPLTWQDKVKVVRTRRHVSDLESAVKEKEEVVARKRLVRRYVFV